MVNKYFGFRILIMAIIFGIMVIGCDHTKSRRQALIIKNVPQDIIDNGYHFMVVKLGTSPRQAILHFQDIVAISDSEDIDHIITAGKNNLVVPFISMPLTDGSEWTGNGIYDVFLIINDPFKVYQASSIKYNSMKINLPFRKFKELSLPLQ